MISGAKSLHNLTSEEMRLLNHSVLDLSRSSLREHEKPSKPNSLTTPPQRDEGMPSIEGPPDSLDPELDPYWFES